MNNQENIRLMLRSGDPYSALIEGHAFRCAAMKRDMETGLWTSGQKAAGILLCPTSLKPDDHILFAFFNGDVIPGESNKPGLSVNKTGSSGNFSRDGSAEPVAAVTALRWCFEDISFKGDVLAWTESDYESDLLKYLTHVEDTGHCIIFGMENSLWNGSADNLAADIGLDNRAVRNGREELEAKIYAVNDALLDDEGYGHCDFVTATAGAADVPEARRPMEVAFADADGVFSSDEHPPVTESEGLTEPEHLAGDISVEDNAFTKDGTNDNGAEWSVAVRSDGRAIRVICLWSGNGVAELAIDGKAANTPEARGAMSAALKRLKTDNFSPLIILDELDVSAHRLVRGFGFVSLKKIAYMVGKIA